MTETSTMVNMTDVAATGAPKVTATGTTPDTAPSPQSKERALSALG